MMEPLEPGHLPPPPPPLPTGANPFPAPTFGGPPGPPPAQPLTPRRSVVGRRVGAGFIDLVPLVLVSIGLSHRTEGPGWQVRLEGWRLLAFIGIALGYYLVCEAVSGTTPGKRLVGLTVVDEHGGRPGFGTVLKRTLVRVVDAFPALYLVGFIAMVASVDKQRLGDMVARTRVVLLADAQAEAAERGAPPPRTRSAFLAVVAVLAVAGGIVGIAGLAGSESPSERLGSFEIERDMKPRIDEIMTAFEDPDAATINALFVDGVSTVEQIDGLLTQIDDTFGPYQGTYEVVDHQKLLDVSITQLDGSFDLMQFKLDADFEKGQRTVIVTFADIDGQLEFVAWNVA